LCPAANSAPLFVRRARWITSGLPKGPTGKIVKREIVLPDDLGL